MNDKRATPALLAPEVALINGIIDQLEPIRTRRPPRRRSLHRASTQAMRNLGKQAAPRDRGHARDHVTMRWLMPQQELPGDFVHRAVRAEPAPARAPLHHPVQGVAP